MEADKSKTILEFLAYYHYQTITSQSEIRELEGMTNDHYSMCR